MPMFTRQLGQINLAVSALCFGGNVFGWTLGEHGSYAVLDAYLDAGGNCIDTADVYGQGTSRRSSGRDRTVPISACAALLLLAICSCNRRRTRSRVPAEAR